ncbi:hypothetical protein [Thermococcus sp.]
MRLISTILVFLAITPLLAVIGYHQLSTSYDFVGPYTIQPSTPERIDYVEFYFPSKSLADLTCNGGRGRVYIFDTLSKTQLVNFSFREDLSTKFVVPHEGDYAVVYYGKEDTQCVIRFEKEFPAVAVQNAYLTTGIISLVALILIWRVVNDSH